MMLEARLEAISRPMAKASGCRALAPCVGGLLLGRVVDPERRTLLPARSSVVFPLAVATCGQAGVCR